MNMNARGLGIDASVDSTYRLFGLGRATRLPPRALGKKETLFFVKNDLS